jgi:N-acetylmuramoyl-L-alanine amidase
MAKYKVALSDGHGSQTPGKRTPDGYRENKFNSAVIDHLNTELKRCGFDTKLVAPTDADTSLKARTDAANAWDADIYFSCHFNALADKWRDGEGGIETFYHEGSTNGKKLANAIHKRLMAGTKMRDRGLKTSNLHETRETKMPAALAECGFMDIKREADLMKSAAYQKECAVEIAKGICDYFGVTYKAAPAPVAPSKPTSNVNTPTTKKEIHRVISDGKQIGAFSDDKNITEAVAAQLKSGAKKITIEQV